MRRAIRRSALVAVICCVLWPLTSLAQACAANEDNPPAAQPGADRPVACPRLASQLYQLAQASDPAAFAASTAQEYVDGRVRVIVELAGSSDPAPAYGLVEEARYANQLQALVPPDQLCALANDVNVAFVRSATSGGADRVPGGGADGPPGGMTDRP